MEEDYIPRLYHKAGHEGLSKSLKNTLREEEQNSEGERKWGKKTH